MIGVMVYVMSLSSTATAEVAMENGSNWIKIYLYLFCDILVVDGSTNSIAAEASN